MATIQVRVDDSIKSAADSLFKSLGFDTSTAIRIFLSAALENNGLPFDIRHEKERIPNVDLLEAINDVRFRRNLSGPFDTAEDAIRSMLED
jgi:DNA-damage-inducible protein J